MKRTSRLLVATLTLFAITLMGCEQKRAGGQGHEHEDEHGQDQDDEHGNAHAEHEEEHAHGKGHEGDHDHNHGSEGYAAITHFGDEFELFAEYAMPVTGKEMTFLSHLTILKGYKPLDSGKIELTLKGAKSVTAKETAMLRAGIFQSSLTAPDAGTYTLELKIEGKRPTGELVEETLSGMNLVVYATEAEAKKAKSAEPPRGVGEPISFLKEKQWQIPFGTQAALRGSLVLTVEVAGEITTPPDGQAEVGAAISGRLVPRASGLPRPGQTVKKGELLATIAPAPSAPEDGARAELAVVEAQARLEAANARLSRAERLIKDGAIAQREVDDARREVGVASDSVKAAERARSIFSGASSGQGGGTYQVTTPIAGTVSEVKATSGKSVQSGELLFRIVSTEELWITAKVPEQSASLLRSDQNASFRLPGLDTWLPLTVSGDAPNAKVVNVGRTVDARSRTVALTYSLFVPDERLRVGAMVRVAAPVGAPWEGLIVPRSAVMESDGRTFVYVQLEGESFDERVVSVAQRSGESYGITSGLQEGERVVTEGANVIRLSARAESGASHGHVH